MQAYWKTKWPLLHIETNNPNIVYQRNVHLARNRLGCKMATAFVTSNPACIQKNVKCDNKATKGEKLFITTMIQKRFWSHTFDTWLPWKYCRALGSFCESIDKIRVTEGNGNGFIYARLLVVSPYIWKHHSEIRPAKFSTHFPHFPSFTTSITYLWYSSIVVRLATICFHIDRLTENTILQNREKQQYVYEASEAQQSPWLDRGNVVASNSQKRPAITACLLLLSKHK